jgi:predicted RNA-binding protein associated with RNAse of E/G family
LHDGPSCKISILHIEERLRIGEIEVDAGGVVLWYLFPGRRYEVAAVHDYEGTILGYYTNFVRPPDLNAESWDLTDLYLDIWQAPGADACLLDQEDLDNAVAVGAIGKDEAREVEAEAAAVLQSARAGRWPPRIVREYPLEDVPSLRLRRDEPGTYFANLIVGRLIAFGIYALGAVSLTSLAFAAMTDAFQADDAGIVVWMAVIGIELVILFGLSLAGRLPATRRPRPEEVLTEKILFTGALISGLALFLYPDSELWRNGLAGIYSALGVFLAVFAAARFRYERRFPGLAAIGVGVCLAALLILL